MSLDTILKFFKSIYVTQNEKLLCMSIHNNITMVKLHDRHLNLVKRVHNNFAITYIQGCLKWFTKSGHWNNLFPLFFM
ncbi:hypothetical protein AUQ34_17875 [Escherichia coli]|nr:hypothetical protein AUQ34_17875 [Escherichia coli]